MRNWFASVAPMALGHRSRSDYTHPINRGGCRGCSNFPELLYSSLGCRLRAAVRSSTRGMHHAYATQGGRLSATREARLFGRIDHYAHERFGRGLRDHWPAATAATRAYSLDRGEQPW